MSLTSFLKQPDVIKNFRQHFEPPKIRLTKTLLAPPLTNHYSLVGTAFDYLLRFYIERLNKNAICGHWVAEQSLRILEEEEEWGYDIANKKQITPDDSPVVARALSVFKQAQIAHRHYLSTSELTDQLLESAIHLAQLDPIYRAGFIDENLGKAHKEDVKDLRNLIALVKPKLFLSNSLCLLNPDFGKASKLVGGADADLLMDDALIDIKTVKDCVLKPDYYYQLLGYFILHQLSAIADLKPKPKINKIGVYFSRHGHLELFDLQDINVPKTFVDWFAERASRQMDVNIKHSKKG